MSETNEGISAVRVSEACMDQDCSHLVSVQTGHSGKVFDANGDEVTFCIEANLMTGRCVIFARDESGVILKTAAGGIVKRDVVMRPAPLMFIPKVIKRNCRPIPC